MLIVNAVPTPLPPPSRLVVSVDRFPTLAHTQKGCFVIVWLKESNERRPKSVPNRRVRDPRMGSGKMRPIAEESREKRRR